MNTLMARLSLYCVRGLSSMVFLFCYFHHCTRTNALASLFNPFCCNFPGWSQSHAPVATRTRSLLRSNVPKPWIVVRGVYHMCSTIATARYHVHVHLYLPAHAHVLRVLFSALFNAARTSA